MSNLILPSRSLQSVDPGHPVNWQEPINEDLRLWCIGLPSHSGGDTFRDIASGLHGTLTGFSLITWPSLPGPVAAQLAPEITGAAPYIAFGNPAPLRFGGTPGFSFSAWTTLYDSAQDRTLLEMTFGGGATAVQVDVTGGNFRVGGRSLPGDSFQSTTVSGTPLVSTTAVHIGGSLDIPGDTIRIYINGAKVKSTGVAFGRPADFYEIVGSLFVANDATPDTANEWYGQIGDFRLWARVLSDNDFASVYEDSRTGYQRTLNRIRRWFPVGVAAGGTTILWPWQIRRSRRMAGVR